MSEPATGVAIQDALQAMGTEAITGRSAARTTEGRASVALRLLLQVYLGGCVRGKKVLLGR